jgi:hypothetical protein
MPPVAHWRICRDPRVARVPGQSRCQAQGFEKLNPTILTEVWVGIIVGTPLQSGQPETLVGEGKRQHALQKGVR